MVSEPSIPVVSCTEMTISAAEEERCKELLGKLKEAIDRRGLMLDELGKVMNKMVSSLATFTPLLVSGATESTPISTATNKVSAVANAAPSADATLTDQAPTRRSMNCSDDDTASQTSASIGAPCVCADTCIVATHPLFGEMPPRADVDQALAEATPCTDPAPPLAMVPDAGGIVFIGALVNTHPPCNRTEALGDGFSNNSSGSRSPVPSVAGSDEHGNVGGSPASLVDSEDGYLTPSIATAKLAMQAPNTKEFGHIANSCAKEVSRIGSETSVFKLFRNRVVVKDSYQQPNTNTRHLQDGRDLGMDASTETTAWEVPSVSAAEGSSWKPWHDQPKHHSRGGVVVLLQPWPPPTQERLNWFNRFDEWDQHKEDSSSDWQGRSSSHLVRSRLAWSRNYVTETHPDVAAAAGSRRFLQILAAYEILSDSHKRAHYNSYLRLQSQVVQKQPRPSQHVYSSGSGIVLARESNVVEWLKWYRLTIDDIVTKKRVATGSGYFDRLESELYSAIHAAYYGPDIETMDLFPDCFEAEERSVYETSELLHLVSGRDLFGIVSLADSIRELSDSCREKLAPSGFGIYGVAPNVSIDMEEDSIPISPVDIHKKENKDSDNPPSDAYKDIALRICGRVVATATRSFKCICIDKSVAEDHIHVFLVPNEVVASDLIQGHLLLGTITGLATTGEEGSCCVYDGCGIKTHVIVKHRTLLVKHMHWYQVGDEVSPCECRCSRARLSPSRYWLFEPRCYMHDTGGWYIETFGRDKKGRTIPSPRQWDGFNERDEKRLHPAMYLVALAYRSLDLKDARRSKWSIRNFLELQLSHIHQLCKKFFNGEGEIGELFDKIVRHERLSEADARRYFQAGGDGVQVRLGRDVLLIPWDPGGNDDDSSASAWGQAEIQGGKNVTVLLMGCTGSSSWNRLGPSHKQQDWRCTNTLAGQKNRHRRHQVIWRMQAYYYMGQYAATYRMLLRPFKYLLPCVCNAISL